MPNINDINGVTVANIAKVDAVLKANISKVNGLTLAAAFLLDTYTGAAAAYSTRKLKTGVTVAARIRRSGDDIEADVEFDSNNEISLTSPISNASSGTYTDLADFVDHSTTPRDAFVDEWKDQSGSSNHATQSTLTSQPKLYDATTGLITENGKPALDLDGTNDYLQVTTSSLSGGYVDLFAVSTIDTFSTYGTMLWGSTTSTNIYYQIADKNATEDNAYYQASSAPITIPFNVPGSVQRLYEFYGNSTTAKISINSTEYTAAATVPSVPSGTLVYRMGSYAALSGIELDGKFQEFIIWPSNQSTSNRTGITTNINGYFSIYT